MLQALPPVLLNLPLVMSCSFSPFWSLSALSCFSHTHTHTRTDVHTHTHSQCTHTHKKREIGVRHVVGRHSRKKSKTNETNRKHHPSSVTVCTSSGQTTVLFGGHEPKQTTRQANFKHTDIQTVLVACMECSDSHGNFGWPDVDKTTYSIPCWFRRWHRARGRGGDVIVSSNGGKRLTPK